MRKVETFYPENTFYFIFSDLITLHINYGRIFFKVEIQINEISLKSVV